MWQFWSFFFFLLSFFVLFLPFHRRLWLQLRALRSACWAAIIFRREINFCWLSRVDSLKKHKITRVSLFRSNSIWALKMVAICHRVDAVIITKHVSFRHGYHFRFYNGREFTRLIQTEELLPAPSHLQQLCVWFWISRMAEGRTRPQFNAVLCWDVDSPLRRNDGKLCNINKFSS